MGKITNGKDEIIDILDLVELRERVNWFYGTYFDEPHQEWMPPWDGIDVNKPFGEVMMQLYDDIETEIARQMGEILKYPELLSNPRLNLVDGEYKEDMDGEY